LSTEGIKPIPEKVQVIINLLPPKVVSKLRSFLSAMGYYRKYIKDFAQNVNPLFRLFLKKKKNTPFEWTKEADEAYNSLKERLIV
jgi:hypothetical protein